MRKTVCLLNGPNLNLLGTRQPDVYGFATIEDVIADTKEEAARFSLDIYAFQSNSEGALVDEIQKARESAAAIIINPGAYSHTSVAILDALNMFDGPVVEVHISQIHKREAFRHHSYVSHRADAVIAGCGTNGYRLAMQQVAHLLD